MISERIHEGARKARNDGQATHAKIDSGHPLEVKSEGVKTAAKRHGYASGSAGTLVAPLQGDRVQMSHRMRANGPPRLLGGAAISGGLYAVINRPRQKLLHTPRGQRLREQVSLHFGTSGCLNHAPLLGCLDTLGRD